MLNSDVGGIRPYCKRENIFLQQYNRSPELTNPRQPAKKLTTCRVPRVVSPIAFPETDVRLMRIVISGAIVTAEAVTKRN